MKLSKNAKRMVLLIMAASLVIMACGAAYYRSPLTFPFALGVAMTGALNCWKVIMLERTVHKSLDKGGGAKAYAGGQYLLRFALTGVVLYIAATQDFISLWGAAAGIFTLQIAAYSLKFFIDRDEKTGNFD